MRRTTPHSCIGCSSSEIPDKHRLCFNRKIQTKPLNSHSASSSHSVASAAVLQRFLTNVIFVLLRNPNQTYKSTHAPRSCIGCSSSATTETNCLGFGKSQTKLINIHMRRTPCHTQLHRLQFFRDSWQTSSLFYWEIQIKLINIHMRRTTPHSCIGCSSSEIPDKGRLWFNWEIQTKLINLYMHHGVASDAIFQRFLTKIVFVLLRNPNQTYQSTHAPNHATQLHWLQFFRNSWQTSSLI